MKISLARPFYGLVIVLLLISCKIEPQAIEFGKDQCNFCDMNIVDKVHAAQYVTDKGKQFKFDAIECMIHEINDIGEEHIAIILVSDFGKPGTMTDAKGGYFLVSEGIKSPMGANLTGFAQENQAKEQLNNHGGALYSWESIKKKLE